MKSQAVLMKDHTQYIQPKQFLLSLILSYGYSIFSIPSLTHERCRTVAFDHLGAFTESTYPCSIPL